MDFKNFFAWLMGMKKLIFHYNNFFGPGWFLTIFSDLMDQKMAGAKKVVIIKNQFFHARQACEGIFEICSHWCCIFTIFGQSFKWPPVIQEIKFFDWKLVGIVFTTCRIEISGLILNSSIGCDVVKKSNQPVLLQDAH